MGLLLAEAKKLIGVRFFKADFGDLLASALRAFFLFGVGDSELSPLWLDVYWVPRIPVNGDWPWV
jgi:hypothetical protein